MSSRARDVASILTTIENIDVTAQLDERLFISSASPSTGNIDGRLWVDTTTASAPVLQVYGGNEFKNTRISRIKALGGNITEVGPYRIHEFLSDGTFTALEPLTIEYLVVAGGGGAARNTGRIGGAGAGGYRTGTLSVTAGNKTVTIGGGGALNANGANSVFDSIISTGGGKGGDYNVNGSAGGSGGGGGGDSSGTAGTGGAASPAGQGFTGGNANNSGTNPLQGAGGGGGGAGAVGQNASTSAVAGNGGNGLQSSISGTATYYAGGGGGGSREFGTRGLGGLGGGGNGKVDAVDNGSAGTTNPGGGGGGGYTGGSGIVIVRYLI
jgi:hypothetical protein